MKTKPVIVLSLGLSVLLSGCVGTGPNTQQGAVGGATLGALVGAIIGHNSRGGDAVGGAVLGGIAGGIAGGAYGNSIDHQRGTIYTSERQATTDMVVEEPPPVPMAPREVVEVRPAADAVWVPGYWAYAGGRRYTWVAGYWTVPPPHYRRYVPPHWRQRAGTYVYIQGYWH